MVGYRAVLALTFAVFVAACATAPLPSQRQSVPSLTASLPQAATSPSSSLPEAEVPSGSPKVAAVSHDPSPATTPRATPAPTAGPLSVKEAGAALLAAWRRLQAAWLPLQDKYYLLAPCAYTGEPCRKTQFKDGKQYWGTLAVALGMYVMELKVIRFPTAAAAAGAAYIKTAVAFHDRALSASKASTLDMFNSRAAAAAAARDGKYMDDEQVLLDALGLPVGP